MIERDCFSKSLSLNSNQSCIFRAFEQEKDKSACCLMSSGSRFDTVYLRSMTAQARGMMRKVSTDLPSNSSAWSAKSQRMLRLRRRVRFPFEKLAQTSLFRKRAEMRSSAITVKKITSNMVPTRSYWNMSNRPFNSCPMPPAPTRPITVAMRMFRSRM